MENSLSKAITISALTGFLVVGAAAAAILGRESVPAAGAAMEPSAMLQQVVPNRESKGDRLTVAVVTSEATSDSVEGEPARTESIPNEPLRQAFAATPPAEIEGLKLADPAASKPKVIAKPPVQKSYALLSDAQIAGITERL